MILDLAITSPAQVLGKPAGKTGKADAPALWSFAWPELSADTDGGACLAPVGAAPEECLLIVSPLLPLPVSLPQLIRQTLDNEPDYVIERQSEMQTPRVGPWELVLLSTDGRSAATGVRTCRFYVAMDAGFGAFLLLLIEREPERLEQRRPLLEALLRHSRLRKPAPRRPEPEVESEPKPEQTATQTSQQAPAPASGTTSPPDSPDPRDGEIFMPPQVPPPELFYKDVLFRHYLE